MGKLHLERRPQGLALAKDGRAAPLGYVRGGKLRMKCGDDYEEFAPEDLERLAQEIREAMAVKVWRMPMQS